MRSNLESDYRLVTDAASVATYFPENSAIEVVGELVAVAESVAVCVLHSVRRVPRIQSPVVSSGVDVPYPPPVENLPTIRHPIPIRVRVGGVSRSIATSTGP